MIRFEGKEYLPLQNETLLDCLSRYGVELPHSCRSGICQSCLMKAQHGTPPELSQKNLKPSLKSQNYFLACACIPTEPLEVELPDSASFRYQAVVLDKFSISPEIIRLRLSVPENFSYSAGQYLSIFKSDRICRSYSLASLPDVDKYLEFHIRVYEHGVLSRWIAEELGINMPVTISQASGSCIYISEDMDQPLVLIGNGTGLAPLFGIARNALIAGHRGLISLYHGAKSVSELYLDSELKKLSTQYPQFNYIPCVSNVNETPNDSVRAGPASDNALADFTSFRQHKIYLCGGVEMVQKTKRAVFLAGASLNDIESDAFLFQ